jgi:energy-coupling factor transporter ATP-binding protein EcfA2
VRLELRHADLSYQRGSPFESQALAGVSLTVEPGERLGIAGPVGSGKSSLLAVLAGIVEPDSGSVIHDGVVLGKKTPVTPGSLGLAFQSPENCLFGRTVHEDVSFAPRRMGADEMEVHHRVREALDAVGLEYAAMAGRSPFSLSAGEQRRVALAGVLAMRPRALLLDEPTANLDPASRRDLIDRLLALNAEKGTTVVMVGHDMDEMARLAGRLAIVDEGRLAAHAPAADLLADGDLLERYGLQAPGTVRLSHMLALATGNTVTPALTEAEAVEAILAAAGAGRAS